jgi:hypothetical protein
MSISSQTHTHTYPVVCMERSAMILIAVDIAKDLTGGAGCLCRIR